MLSVVLIDIYRLATIWISALVLPRDIRGIRTDGLRPIFEKDVQVCLYSPLSDGYWLSIYCNLNMIWMEIRSGEWGDHVTLQAAADSVWFTCLPWPRFMTTIVFSAFVFRHFTPMIEPSNYFSVFGGPFVILILFIFFCSSSCIILRIYLRWIG